MKQRRATLQKRKDNPRSRYWLLKADAAFRKVVSARDKSCAVCGASVGRLSVHHLLTRADRLHRHDPMNGIVLCDLHHVFSTVLSAHGNPLAFAIWLENYRPEQWEWVKLNRFCTGRPDYQLAFEQLTAGLSVADGTAGKSNG